MMPTDAAVYAPTLMLGDCLKLLATLPPASVDMVVCDPPYGVLNRSNDAAGWDMPIPLDPLWDALARVAKPDAAIVFFAQGMFTARLMMSRPKLWRYNMVWDKRRSSGFLNARKMPLRSHEDICVFYRRQPHYDPQLFACAPSERTHSRGKLLRRSTNRCYGEFRDVQTSEDARKFPGSILRFPRPHGVDHHPTEKSVDLVRWLVRSYTRPGALVLDPTMGAGTTCVACVREGRRSIGIEADEEFFAMARRRVGALLDAGLQGELLPDAGRRVSR